MVTINISLPDKLKNQAQRLVEEGYYVSFSDLVRDSLRKVIDKNEYDLLADNAEYELKKGRAKELKTKKEIKEFFDNL
jgi:Arc/MetJ-type ribon-helix-helix transcriptional regulator